MLEFDSMFDGSEGSEQFIDNKPESKVLSWKSTEQAFCWYDRFDEPDAEGNKGQNIAMAMPMYFLMIASRIHITGYDQAQNKGVRSNYVNSVQVDELHVRSGSYTASGYWQSLKEEFAKRIAEHDESQYDFTVAVWGCVFTKEGSELVRIDLKRSALENWFKGGFSNNGQPIKMFCDPTQRKSKGNKYWVPAFESTGKKITDEEKQKFAVESMKSVREYLDNLNKPQQAKPVTSNAPIAVEANTPLDSDNDTDDLPF